MRDRIKADPHPMLVKHLFAPGLQADAAEQFEGLMRVNLAHTLMLARNGIIPEADARALLTLYQEMRREGSGCLELDPRLEDLHFNVEAYTIQRLGADVGGKMHTGRSRNDLRATITRISARETGLRMIEGALELRSVLLERAASDAGVVMPGYTHMQPAQPITFGYYMSGVADALERDTGRLMAAYERTNRSPLGAGAMAGTGFPLDREMVARLLGFEGLVENCLDAIASRDFALELLSALAILTTTISRMAHDLYIWATDEFALIELSDEVSVVSSIMPQKKNPVTLEHCKSKAAHLLGALVAALSATRAAPFTNVRDVNRESIHPLAEAASEAEATMKLMAVTLRGLSLKAPRMLARAQDDFSTVTELADSLVRNQQLSFRLAHHIVAEVVAEAVAAGKRAPDIDVAAVNRAAERVLGRHLPLEEAEVRSALDAALNVQGKRVVGAPRPDEVSRMARRGLDGLEADGAWLAERQRRLAQAYQELDRAVAELLG